LELVAATVLGAGLGYGLDRWLGTGPWLLVVGVVLGAAAGFLAVYRLVNASDS
jgi:ATP synthase protein I